MIHPKSVFIVIAVLITFPVVLLLIAYYSQPLDLDDLVKSEQDVVRVIERLGINAGTNDRFPCNFGPRGHFVVERDRNDSTCHVVEFDLIPSCCVPVGHRQDISETIIDRLVDELARFAQLRRVVLPNALEREIGRLQAELPRCEIFTQLSDSRRYSSEVVITQGRN